MKSHPFKFRFAPSLITLLGEQLIHDKKIALAELVKNAYDADASFVKIKVNADAITIEDDGCGMNLDIINNIWLQPGISEKKQQVKNNEVTPKYNRLPIGEKGVGRLGAHKLGKKIEVYSKMKGAKTIHFEIDWNSIEEAKDFDKLEAINVSELDEKDPTPIEDTGTYLKITDLKENWNEKDFKEFSNQLLQIISPFSSKNDFDISIYYGEELFGSSLKDVIKEIKKQALYEFEITIENGIIHDFIYEFKPWKSINKVPVRKISFSDDKKYLEKLIESQKLIDDLKLSENSVQSNDQSDGIGKIIFSGFIYDFDNELLRNEFSPQHKKQIKDYMKESSGIRIYKDDMRVYNYGDDGFDILELDLKRVNRPAGQISSNQIAGFVQLERKSSTELIEKTNREGFIHNTAFKKFRDYLKNLIQLISVLRKDDKAKIINVYLNKVLKADVSQKLNKLNDIIDKSELEEESKEKIKKDLHLFAKDIEYLKNVLLTASNTGLNMTFIVHEIDKILDHLEEKIKEKNLTQIKKVFIHLKNSIDTYKDVIRLDKKVSSLSVDDIIEQALFSAEYRFDCHNIKCTTDIKENLTILGKKGLILGIFTNLFDNAIYWLETYGIKEKKILIKAYQDNDFVSFLIADNGKGFNISFETALSAFISGRKEETSMGIGLHLAEQVMIAHEGSISHGDWQEENLPEEFANGAVIKLKFKKGRV